MKLTRRRSGALALAIAMALGLLAAQVADAARCRSREDDVRTPWRQLSWEDFKAPAPGRMGWQGAEIDTSVSLDGYEIAVEHTEAGTFRARVALLCLGAWMNKLQSGYKPEAKNGEALAHEQGHFDISEIHARKLRTKLKALTAEAETAVKARQELKAALHAAFEGDLLAWEAMERAYDRETNNGAAKRKQKAWLRKIAEQLDETAAAAD